MKGSYREVPKGGRVAQKSAGAKATGKPKNAGSSGRGEFATESAGTPGGKLSKGRAEFATEKK
jgi:hypothetical protein